MSVSLALHLFPIDFIATELQSMDHFRLTQGDGSQGGLALVESNNKKKKKKILNWVSSLKKTFSKNEKKSLKTTKDKAITI